MTLEESLAGDQFSDAKPSQAGALPSLETERLRLDAVCERDRDFLIRIDCDPEVMRHVNSGPLSRGQSEQFVDAVIQMEQFRQKSGVRRRYGKWVVRNKVTLVQIGWVETFKYSHGENSEWLGDYTAFGYEFLPEFWGQGFATEAVSNVLEYWRRRYPEEPVFAYVREENDRSRRVLEKSGFIRLESTVKDEGGKLCLLYAVKCERKQFRRKLAEPGG